MIGKIYMVESDLKYPETPIKHSRGRIKKPHRRSMFNPNDKNDDSDVEEEYYNENEDQSETKEEKKEIILEIERPLTYVLGKPIFDEYGKKNISKIKRPIIFNGTKNGWKSKSFVKGFTNDYVSNETWDLIENDWLRCDLRDIEVFWDEEEFNEHVREIYEKNTNYNNYSEAFQKRGLNIIEEVEVLKQLLK